MIDGNAINNSIRAYYDYRKNHPYHHKEWRTNSNVVADCKQILNTIADYVKTIVTQIIGDRSFTIKVSQGASYFPKTPWIGVMFEGETPTNGVYPVIAFYDDGFIIGCVESLMKPQRDFSAKFGFSLETLSKLKTENDRLHEHADEHMSNESSFFDPSEVDFDKLSKSLETAIKVYDQYRNTYSTETLWYDVIRVSNVHDWLSTLTNGNIEREFPLLFRGQGDAKWGLETGLGRSIHKSDGRSFDMDRIISYEQDSRLAFKRELARNSEYKNFDGVDLVSLMQHYGSKTRLLDFSFSPLVALYMALEQYYNHLDQAKVYAQFHKRDESENVEIEALAVWMVDSGYFLEQDALKSKMQNESKNIAWWKLCQMFHDDANAILMKSEKINLDSGIDVIVPNANSTRSSAQEGLFLMPRRMSESFESNLNVALKREGGVVKKYVFASSLVEDLKNCLDRFCITAKLIYPDLTGLAKSMNNKVYFG